MTYNDFKNKYLGKQVDRDGYPASQPYQCMDLAHMYAIEVVGKDFAPAPGAKDVWNQTIEGYDKIPNTPEGMVQQGDLIVWNGNTGGGWGHIAIVDQSIDINNFISLDQNWSGPRVTLENHNYLNVSGWFRPQKSIHTGDTIEIGKDTFEELVTKATRYDEFVNAGYNSVQDVKDKEKKCEEDKQGLNNQITELNEKINQNNEDYLDDIEDLQNQLDECKDTPPVIPQDPPKDPPTDNTEPQKAPLVRFANWIMHLLR